MSEGSKFVQGIAETCAENPARVLMKRVKDGSKFVVLLMAGSTNPNIGAEKKYPYVEFVEEKNGMKYYQEVGAPVNNSGQAYAPTDPAKEVTKEIPEVLDSAPVDMSYVVAVQAGAHIAASAGMFTKDMDAFEQGTLLKDMGFAVLRAAKSMQSIVEKENL